jgi:hypothetical protein
MSQEVIEITEREIEIIEVVERGPAGPTGPQANINYTVVSSPQTLSNSQNIAADTSGGTFTLTLPLNPNEGDSIDIFDYSETFDTNPLIIARNGQRIESIEENLVCNVEGAYFTMIYTGATRGWQILPRYGTSGGGGESILTNQGDTLYRGALVNERLPIGTAGQILKVNSTSTAPEWGAAPATGVTSVTGTAPIASSGGATPAISISAATQSAAGSMSSADKTKLDGIAANANNYAHPNHSGDVTSVGDGATTIANDAVTNAKLANMATATIKGRATAGTGDPEDLSASSVRTLLNTDQVTDARTPLSHTHGNLTNAGAIGTTANLPLKTGTNGVVEAGSFGTSAGSFCEGNDARLSDDRDPNLHAASHLPEGADEIFDQDLNTDDDVQFNSVSATDNSGTLKMDGYGLLWEGNRRWDLETSSFLDTQGEPMLELAAENSIKAYLPIDFAGEDAATNAATTRDNLGLGDAAVEDTTAFAASGSITTSGLTQATARILGRTTASTGAVEEITIGSGLSLSAGELSSTVSAGIPATLLDAKGDLIVGSAADTAARLAVGGTNGHVLTVDSNETLGVKWAAAAGGGSGGATNLWIPASAWIPKTTAGCGVDSRETTTNDQNFDELLFDTGSDEFADALVIMPSNYNNGTVTARFYWTAASGSGTVEWAIQGRAFANDDALDTAAGTKQAVNDTLIAANDMHITSATSACTIGGTPAANTPIQFTIYRDVSEDSLAVDARLLGVEIIFN